MIIIYVKKSWLDEIASEHFMVGDRARELVRLYASKIDLVFHSCSLTSPAARGGKTWRDFPTLVHPCGCSPGHVRHDRDGKEEAGILQRFRVLSNRVVSLCILTPTDPMLRFYHDPNRTRRHRENP